MKRAIITGATGAVGTALVQELIKNEIEILVFCRADSKRNNQIPEHPLVKKVFCSLDQLEKMENMTGKKYDVFYHLAWAGTTGKARDNLYLQNENVKYSLDAVGVAKKFGCDTFIGAGSQAEYGRMEGVLKPNLPTHPENGYGIGKLCAGHMTKEYAHQLGLKHIWVRILSIYGPNDGNQSMVMSTIRKLRKGEVPQFTKGEQMWDYLYSGDAAKAFYLLGERGKDGKIYVLGSGKARKLVEYIKDIREVISPDAKLDIGKIPYSEKQVMFLQADISDLENDVHFFPQMKFKNGIKQIVENGIDDEL